MHKLARASNEHLSSILRTRFGNPTKTPLLVSLFHQGSQKLRASSSKTTSNSAVALPAPGSEDDNHGSQSSHPWPEWADLMECLRKGGYFRGEGNGVLGGKESNVVRTACLNFARDRCDLIRFLSRKDIRVIAACGCPSLDRKVVKSGKRLRAHVGIDEGDVCSSCNLRGGCDRAYVEAGEYDGVRTVDVMRFLLTYGLHPVCTVENKPCLSETVTESVRILMKEIAGYAAQTLDSDLPKPSTSENVASVSNHQISQEKECINVPMKHGDWLCPKCDFLNFAKNIKCLCCDSFLQERLTRLREDQEHLPLKKGDWICEKCNFLNFARNTRCLQCKEKPPKRHLNPGEWECPSCNYINFSRNMMCLKCDHKRPKAANSSGISAQNLIEPAGCRESRRSKFNGGDNADVHTRSNVQQETRNHSTFMWRATEEERREHAYSNSRNEASDFLDFPIAGGKSELSKDKETRERWRSEMMGRGKVIRNDEFESPSIPRMLDLPKYASDEDMAEWFGPTK